MAGPTASCRSAGTPSETSCRGRWRQRRPCFARSGGFGPEALAPGAPEGLACTPRRGLGGARLELCLHGGGHSLRMEHIAHGWAGLVADGRLWRVSVGHG
ncbi:hypothetical protein LNKW23_24220 [Paralimibaculum aggregatum]|uniref:Uncharacterized protein n=1 Tax=Paralimibaculum aggregatum TaxID=3036245 RepID=A0ABQ6LIX1_9RHOB|nr:hypothetical protein LNKW23_24220 [Limibaculum sp. NKW23]